MDIRKLEKSIKIFEQIKQLDKDIIEIDRFAMLAANDKIKASFELKIEDIGNKNEEAEKVKFDEDGSIIKSTADLHNAWHRMIMPSFTFGIDKGSETDKSVNQLKSDLSENATLQILGVLLYEKQSKRNLLIQKLKLFGVSV